MANASNHSLSSIIPNITRDEELEDVHSNSEVDTLYTLMYVFAVLIVLPGIFGNGIIITAVLKLRNLRTHTNQLIASLAVADLLIVLSMVAFVLMDRFPISTLPLEMNMFLFPSIDMTLGSASIWNLAAVSIDRGIAVMLPLHYKGLLSSRKVKIGTGIIWIYSAFVFILAMLRVKIQSEEYNTSLVFAAMIANFVLPCFIVVVIYIGIFASAIKSIRVSKALEKALQLANSRGVELGNVSSRKGSSLLSREVKVALNVLIILVPLVVGWGFYFGTHWYEMMTGDYNRSNIYEFCLLVIPWINSSLNPVVYIFATPSLRKACRRLLCGRRSFAKDGMLNTVISSFTSRRPSWLERGMSVSSNGERTPKRKKSCDSRRGSTGCRKKSTTFIALDVHIEEDQTATAQC